MDYIGIFRNLQKALAVYGDTGKKEGDTPIKPKSELTRGLEQAIKETDTFCKEKGIDTDKIISAENYSR